MKGLIIAILTGIIGGYRFYKKQFKMGILYFFTAGLAGFGWFYDVFCAIRELLNASKPITMQIEIKGAFAECKKDPTVKRWTVINSLPIGTALNVETAYYDGAPFFQLVAPSGLDIGAFPSEVSADIRSNYPNATISAVLIEKADPEHPYAQIKIIL